MGESVGEEFFKLLNFCGHILSRSLTRGVNATKNSTRLHMISAI